jgi:hypothetical protein
MKMGMGYEQAHMEANAVERAMRLDRPLPHLDVEPPVVPELPDVVEKELIAKQYADIVAIWDGPDLEEEPEVEVEEAPVVELTTKAASAKAVELALYKARGGV